MDPEYSISKEQYDYLIDKQITNSMSHLADMYVPYSENMTIGTYVEGYMNILRKYKNVLRYLEIIDNEDFSNVNSIRKILTDEVCIFINSFNGDSLK